MALVIKRVATGIFGGHWSLLTTINGGLTGMVRIMLLKHLCVQAIVLAESDYVSYLLISGKSQQVIGRPTNLSFTREDAKILSLNHVNLRAQLYVSLF